MTREPRIFPCDDRPDVEVLVDGAWWPGELRMWLAWAGMPMPVPGT